MCELGYEEFLSFGVVIIGGVLMMLGMVEFGEDIFLKLVCIGVLEYVGGLFDVVCNLCYLMVMGLFVEGSV